jgi:hypothetical protein
LAPRAREIPSKTRGLPGKPHQGPLRALGTARKPSGDSLRPAAHQAVRTRITPQGQGPGRNGRALGAFRTARGDLSKGRGRMIGLEDCQRTAKWIDRDHRDSARLHLRVKLPGVTCARFSVGNRMMAFKQATAGLTLSTPSPRMRLPSRNVLPCCSQPTIRCCQTCRLHVARAYSRLARQGHRD